jgi:hypothetical protein
MQAMERECRLLMSLETHPNIVRARAVWRAPVALALTASKCEELWLDLGTPIAAPSQARLSLQHSYLHCSTPIFTVALTSSLQDSHLQSTPIFIAALPPSTPIFTATLPSSLHHCSTPTFTAALPFCPRELASHCSTRSQNCLTLYLCPHFSAITSGRHHKWVRTPALSLSLTLEITNLTISFDSNGAFATACGGVLLA